MTKRMPAFMPAAAAALAIAAAGGSMAKAQPAPAAQATWDWFAENCPAVLAAPDPVNYAGGLDGVSGGVGQTVDGRVRQGSLEVSTLPVGGNPVLLMVHVNDYDGGRAAQCMLQLINPEEAMDGLGDIARAQGEPLLGEGSALERAGGPVVGIRTDGSNLSGMDDGEMVRLSTGGFPPETVLLVNVAPQFVMLSLHVVEAQ